MTNLLAIETSSDACSVALLYRGCLRETSVCAPKTHQQILLPMIEALLHEQSANLADVDAIAFGAGPGSFTGIRLAAAVTQGLAFSLDRPVIPVSSLAACAQQALLQDPAHPGPLLVILDARMNDVYAGAYRQQDQGVTPLAADRLLPVSGLAGFLSAYPSSSRRIGEGWALLPDTGPAEIVYPSARAVLQLALPEYAAGRVLPAAEACPVYLRDEVSWQKWQPKTQRFRQTQETGNTR